MRPKSMLSAKKMSQDSNASHMSKLKSNFSFLVRLQHVRTKKIISQASQSYGKRSIQRVNSERISVFFSNIQFVSSKNFLGDTSCLRFGFSLAFMKLKKTVLLSPPDQVIHVALIEYFISIEITSHRDVYIINKQQFHRIQSVQLSHYCVLLLLSIRLFLQIKT